MVSTSVLDWDPGLVLVLVLVLSWIDMDQLWFILLLNLFGSTGLGLGSGF